MRFIDLSVPIDNNRNWAPWWARTHVKRFDHRFGALAMRLLSGLSSKYLREGLGWANDEISLSTHGTTHLDAPWHYAPTSEGKPAKTIDQVPLEWCFGNGVVLDLRQKQDDELILREDVQIAVEKIRYTIQPKDIVLIQTGNDRYLGKPAYFTHGPGMDLLATRWLLDQGVKITGIDAWGWDGPLKRAARRIKRTQGKQRFWASHYLGADKEYCHLERLTNLDKLPSYGFSLSCFPLKVKGGSAGPARVVAMIDDSHS